MNEIIRRFDGKVRQIACSVCLRHGDRDDVAVAARLALVRAVRLHQSDRGAFTSYATIYMTGAARRESKRLACPREAHLPSPDFVEVCERTSLVLNVVPETSANKLDWGVGLVADVIEGMSPRQQELLAERYIDDLDLEGIARLHGSSVSAVSQRLKTAHSHIRAMLPSAARRAAAA
jgi:RNA polymerase sigma factor (sigma-70 family)